ncbi:MAG: undecaprenyl-diphosphate phosphatase [Bacilli bacterium]|nr:undecaprenyl-diphosphate phosphatase [Bacilli bacterium]
MELIKYLFLGFVQGLTEALPISSSGHLLIFKTLLQANIDFDTLAIITNFGSLIAIMFFFKKDIINLLNSFFKYIKTKENQYKNDFKYCLLVIIGCIPAGLAGVLVKKFGVLDFLEDNVKIVGVSLLITATLLYLVRNFDGKKTSNTMMPKDALKVGAFQILGLLPGVSRSGSTIVGGMFTKLKRDDAFKFSFMMYIPISFAATLLEIKDVVASNISTIMWIYCLLATIVAGIMTYYATKWFRKIVNEGKLIYFSYYCLVVGLLVIIFL